MLSSFSDYLRCTGYNSGRKFLIPVIITFGISVLEIFNIGLIYPILQILVDKDAFEAGYIFKLFNLSSINFSLNQVSLILLSSFLFLTILRGFITYIGFRKIFTQLADDESKFAGLQYHKLLNKEYLFFLNNQSIKIIRDIAISIPQGYSTSLQSAFLLLSEIVVLTGICVALLITNPSIFILTSSIFILAGYFYVKFFSPQIAKLGADRHEHSHKVINVLQQSIDGIAQIRIFGCESYFANIFAEKRDQQAKISSSLQLMQVLPKLYFETIVVTCICVFLAYNLIYSSYAVENLVVIAGFYVVAAMRLLPSILRISAQYNNIVSYRSAIDVVRNLAKEQCKKNDAKTNTIEFCNNINIKNLSFSYNAKEVIKNLNLNLKKNECVGIFGCSGQGKTTLINILMGLLQPNSGTISIDDGEEQIMCLENKLSSIVSYVAQDTYLLDESLRKNVAFAQPEGKIDDEKVILALENSSLIDFAANSSLGLDTVVGERGSRVSGGQKQRIGIARALYFDRDIIIFDEATSSLDIDTEIKICETIQKLKTNKTIIIISHRRQPLTICDSIYEMISGQLVKKEMHEIGIEHVKT